MQIKGPESIEFHPRSYAYRLSKKNQGEFLYEDWYSAFTNFVEDARKVVLKNPNSIVIRTDIESYFTKIKQDILHGDLIHISKTYNSRVADALYLLINRGFDWEENLGIPQGHAMSGLISDIYLQKIDKKFGDNNAFSLEYFRYVDDIIIVCKVEQQEQILKELDLTLDKLGLKRSIKKTRQLSANEFLVATEKDFLLETLGKEHNRLLVEVYKLDGKYYSLAQENWWEFLEKYQKILFRLGVFLGMPRLSRKIKVNTGWWDRTFNYWKKTRFPYVAAIEDLDDVEKWVKEFTDINPIWVRQRQLIQEKLQEILNDSFKVLETSPNELDIARANTRIKFAVYRLGQIGFDVSTSKVAQLLVERPWLINIRRTTQCLGLQNEEEALLQIYRNIPSDKPEWSYIKSCILKAMIELSSLSEEVVGLLCKVIASNDSIIERTMAAEVLFLCKNIDNPNIENLASILSETNDPYLAKNLILVAGKFKPDVIMQYPQIENADILNEAIQISKSKHIIPALNKYEPNILKDYYYGKYPDNPKEFREPPS